MRSLARQHRVLPGFRPALGFTMFYLTLVVLIPLSTLVLKTTTLTWEQFWAIVSSHRVVAAYRLTFSVSFLAAVINGFFGLLVAWVLVRYSFPGHRLVDALIDLPFALPTAVAGIALTSMYSSNGWIGRYLEPYGIKVAFTPVGILVALTFVGLPFVIRTVQPVFQELDAETVEAAASLGAGYIKIFMKVIFPTLWPSLVTGFALSFARSLGEYGSVIFIAGNMPMVSEISSLLIVTKLEQFDYVGATAIASVMLAISFVLLLAINLVQRQSKKYEIK